MFDACLVESQRGVYRLSTLYNLYIVPVLNSVMHHQHQVIQKSVVDFFLAKLESLRNETPVNFPALMQISRQLQTFERAGMNVPEVTDGQQCIVDVTTNRMAAYTGRSSKWWRPGHISEDRRKVAVAISAVQIDFATANVAQNETAISKFHSVLCEQYNQTLTDDLAHDEGRWYKHRDHRDSRLRDQIIDLKNLVIANAPVAELDGIFIAEINTFVAMLRIALNRCRTADRDQLSQAVESVCADELSNEERVFQVEEMLRQFPNIDEMTHCDVTSQYRRIMGLYEYTSAHKADNSNSMPIFYNVNRCLQGLEVVVKPRLEERKLKLKHTDKTKTSPESYEIDLNRCSVWLQSIIVQVLRSLRAYEPNLEITAWELVKNTGIDWQLMVSHETVAPDHKITANTLTLNLNSTAQTAVAKWPTKVQVPEPAPVALVVGSQDVSESLLTEEQLDEGDKLLGRVDEALEEERQREFREQQCGTTASVLLQLQQPGMKIILASDEQCAAEGSFMRTKELNKSEKHDGLFPRDPGGDEVDCSTSASTNFT